MTSEDRREGLASMRVPGVIWQLQLTGELPDRPISGLVDEWWRFESDAERHLDQIGWPLQNDAELARRACCGVGDWNEASRRILGRYLSVPRAPIEDLDEALVTALIPDGSEADRLRLIEMLFRKVDPERQRTFARLESGPIEDPVRAALQSHLEARDGWAAYYAHRQLAPAATMTAAKTLRALLATHRLSVDRIYEWASELATGKSA